MSTDTTEQVTTDQLPLPAEIDAPGDDVADALAASEDDVRVTRVGGTDPVAHLAQAVAYLDDQLDALVEAADDPEGEGLCLMLADVRAARERLYGLEAQLEREAAKALSGDQLVVDGVLRVERYRSRDRKEWRHEDWQRDVRAKVLRQHNLLHAQLVDSNGELLPSSVLYDALTAVQSVHGAGAPKTTALRQLGLDAADYCHTDPGTTKVRVQRVSEVAAE